MIKQPVKENHYNTDVWVNTMTEGLRRDECLCLNCAAIQNQCKYAQEFFKLCKEGDIALMVTRCRYFMEDE
jgi:hypothetical protein